PRGSPLPLRPGLYARPARAVLRGDRLRLFRLPVETAVPVRGRAPPDGAGSLLAGAIGLGVRGRARRVRRAHRADFLERLRRPQLLPAAEPPCGGRPGGPRRPPAALLEGR